MIKLNYNDGDNPTVLNKLNELRELHPQLTEKAIVDYVNVLEVSNDHLGLRDQINNEFFTRIWNSITGTTVRRQQIFDRNITNNLEIVSAWLQDIQLYEAKSDIAVARLASKLKETRTGVMRLQERHNELGEKVQAIKQRLEQFEIEVDKRWTRLESEVKHLSAESHLNRVFTRWQARLFNKYPPLAGLYLMIDELYWGTFGIYCRKEFGTSEVRQLMEQLGHKALILLEAYSKDDVSQLTLPEEWLSPIQKLPEELREVLSYLSNWADSKTAPVTWTIGNTALLKSGLPDDFPRVFSGEHAINHLMYENKKRIQFNSIQFNSIQL
jgi:YjcZ-like protein